MSSQNRTDQGTGTGADQAGTASPAKAGKFRAGQSGNPRGRPRRDAASVARSDAGWTSLLAGLGTLSRDKRESFYFQPEIIDWDTALGIYRGDPMAARIIETKPNELVREGYELCITDEDDKEDERPEEDQAVKGGVLKPGKVEREVLEQRKVFGGKETKGLDKTGKDLQEAVEEKWDELELLPTIHEALCYEAAYGGSAILIGANDGSKSLEEPLVVKNVKSLDFLTALEPRELMPVAWYGNPRAPKYGRPAIYQLTPSVPGMTADGKIYADTIKVHESRLVVFPGIRVTRRNVNNGGWGDSILTRVYRVLRDFNISWGAAGILVADFAQAVYKMKGLNELLQEDGKDLFKQRMLGMELSRSIARAVMIDGDDEFERKQTPVSGLPDLLDRFAVALAAAADLPLPLLMGESPGGLNSSGASSDQLRMFYDKIASMAKRKVVPHIRRITAMIFQTMGGEPDTWSIKPRALWQMTEKEQAEARKIQMEIDCGYMDRGVIESGEIRDSRFGGDAYSHETSLKEAGDGLSAESMAAYVAEQNAAGAATGATPMLGGEGTSAAKPELGPDGKPLPAKPGIGPDAGAFAKLGAPAPAGAMAPVGGVVSPEGGREIQKEAMNGAQISSLLEVIQAANDKAISRESAGAVLRLAFQLKPEDAIELLGPETFVPVKPVVAPSPFGGGPPGAPGAKPPVPGEKPEPGEKPAPAEKPPVEEKPAPKMER